MSSAKVKKSNSVVKNADFESEKVQSKITTIRSRDVVILCISFVFTILVGLSILFIINYNQQQNTLEIEKIVERVLVAREVKLARNEPRNFERKRGYLDEHQEDDYERKKRSIHDFRSQLNGETCE